MASQSLLLQRPSLLSPFIAPPQKPHLSKPSTISFTSSPYRFKKSSLSASATNPLAFSATKLVFQSPAPVCLQQALVQSAGPAFFAAIKNQPPIGVFESPLLQLISGLGRWLDIYSGVLMVRVLLTWFPNLNWERQPFSAIRDLCDPFLSLFRNIIPPVMGTLDVSPVFAFAVLGVVGSILNTNKVP